MLNSAFRFQIVEEEFGTKTLYKLYDSEYGEFVSILPYLGGSINQMVLRKDENLVEILDGYISPQDAEKNLETSFKGSNLLPFPNRIADGKYSFHDQLFHFPINFHQENNAIHGLLFNQELKVIDQEDGEIGCMLILEYQAEESEGYPFKYHFKINYRLSEDRGFECKVKFTNLMDQSIPVGHGWHPYFRLGENAIDNLLLQFPAKDILKVDKRSIPTGELEPYNKFNQISIIGNTVLDNCFLLKDENQYAEIIIMDKSKDFGYKIWQETGKYKYNYLQVYTPPHRKSIAIEPMTCAPDAFNNQMGLVILAPQEVMSTTFGISKI